MPWGIAAAAVGGALVSSMGAQSAADTQAGASEYAAQIGQNEFNTITQQEAPFMQAGYGALSALDYGLGISPQTTMQGNGYGGGSYNNVNGYDPSSGYSLGGYGGITRLIPGGGGLGGSRIPIAGQGNSSGGSPQGTGLGYGSLLSPFTAANWQQLSPAYGFQLQQGQQGVLNSDSAGTGALSGAAQKDLMSFNQNLANTSFGNAFNMYQTQQGNIYQRLAGLTQLGQAAAANTGQQGTALTGQIGQAITNAGTAQAAGQIGVANAYSGALNSAGYLPYLYSGGGGFSPSGSAYGASGADSGYQALLGGADLSMGGG